MADECRKAGVDAQLMAVGRVSRTVARFDTSRLSLDALIHLAWPANPLFKPAAPGGMPPAIAGRGSTCGASGSRRARVLPRASVVSPLSRVQLPASPAVRVQYFSLISPGS